VTRDLAAFARFLEAASFSQAALMNISAVARDCAVERKVVEGWFGVLEDLLIARRLPPFLKRARRRVTMHPKFFFFDAGVYRALRPSGPLDAPEEAEGPALETLILQHLAAVNDALRLGYSIHYWRTATGQEVDLVLYGPRGLLALEVKRRGRVSDADAAGLTAFRADYPGARLILACGADRRSHLGPVEVWPVVDLLRDLRGLLEEGAHSARTKST
jgi:predicted AAA+ superfamily ATPase